jgi:hypothetical protein
MYGCYMEESEKVLQMKRQCGVMTCHLKRQHRLRMLSISLGHLLD